MRRPARGMVLALALVFGAGIALPPARAGDTSPDLLDSIEAQAGGWQTFTPLILAGVAATRDARGEEEFDLRKTLLNRRVVGGVAGDLLAMGIAKGVAPLLPIPPIAKAALVFGAGFLGWEVGSGNLGKTDWLTLGAEVAVGTGVQVGLMAAGLTAFPAGLIAMVAAIAVGVAISHLRRGSRPRFDEDDEPLPAAPAAASVSAGPSQGSGGTVATPPDDSIGYEDLPLVSRPDAYRRTLDALTGRSGEAPAAAYEAYRNAPSAP